MKLTHSAHVGVFVILSLIDLSRPTCVLESDFGFKINCAFKKAGLFRVRNLGGIKAHASLGFSLGDELGFEQSLTNLDPSRRRSVSIKNGPPLNVITGDSGQQVAKQEKRGKQNRIMMRPQMPPSSRPHQSAVETLNSLHRRVSTTMQPIIVAGPTFNPSTVTNISPVPKITMAKPLPMGLPPFKPLPPKEDKLHVLPIVTATKKAYTPLQVPQSKGPGVAYQSEHQYPRMSHDQVSKMVSQMTASHISPYPQQHTGLVRITQSPFIIENYTPRVAMTSHVPYFHALPTTVNSFLPMPLAAPPTQSAMSIIPAPILKNSIHIPLAPQMMSKTPTAYSLAQNTISIHKMPVPEPPNPIYNFVDPVPHHVNSLANQLYPVYNTKKVDEYNTITGYSDDTSLKFDKEDINEKIAEIAKAGNISMEAVEAAIALRQQQLLSKFASIAVPATTTTTSTTTTEAPLVFQPELETMYSPVTPKQKRYPTSGKVMNAPKEYYPVGYEKNFDDQFQSKVDLPDTTFHCGDQKYFPGLYGDENLGCMVFHVCALTDDGLVMKSFLCPESTLFDQTILKCNWWFYVDCKNTRRLYETNIPVSKSYQLMKALTFFSSYKSDMAGDDSRSSNPDNNEGIKEAITILENQESNAVKMAKQNNVDIVTPKSELKATDSNVYRVSSDSREQKHRYNRRFRNTTRVPEITTSNAPSNNSFNRKDDMETMNSEIQVVTVTSGINSRQTSAESSSKENSSKERQYRRRQIGKHTQRNIQTTVKPYIIEKTSVTPPVTTEVPTTPKVEIILSELIERKTVKLNDTKNTELNKSINEMTPIEDGIKIEKIEQTILKDTESLPPIKRFYRSSAESASKEMAFVRNERVQVIRSKPYSTFVGQYPTPTAAIAKLDDAVLGRAHVRHRKDVHVTIVTPHEGSRET